MDFYLRTRLSLLVRAVYKEDTNTDIKWRIPRNQMAYSTTQLRDATFKISYDSNTRA